MTCHLSVGQQSLLHLASVQDTGRRRCRVSEKGRSLQSMGTKGDDLAGCQRRQSPLTPASTDTPTMWQDWVRSPLQSSHTTRPGPACATRRDL